MVPTTKQFSFLHGGGEMGELISQFDWASTSLGDPSKWPQSLRTTLSILINSKFPMFLFWGEDLLCFYNDAFRPSLGSEGKHPWALGSKGKDVWKEIWPTIHPWLSQVLNGGEAVWKEDQLVPFYRNGTLEEIYWTFSYSPVNDETGRPAGVFVTCNETTKNVQGLKTLNSAWKQFENIIMQAPVAIAVLRGENLVVETANAAYMALMDIEREEFVGRSLFDILPQTRPVLEPLVRQVLATGQSFNTNDLDIDLFRKGKAEANYFDSSWEPLRDIDGKVEGFVVVAHEISDMVRVRKKIEESEQKLRSVVNSAPFPIGVYEGRQMRITLANQSIMDVWGKGNDVVGKLYSEVLPELGNQAIFDQLDTVFTTGKAFHAREQRVDLMINGKLKPFYFNYSFTPLFDTNGKVYGVMNTAAELTNLVMAKQQLEETEATLRGAIELAELGTWELDVESGKLTFSDRISDWFGLQPDQLLLPNVLERIHINDRARIEQALSAAMETGSSGLYNEEYVVVDPVTGRHRILHAQGKTYFGADGKPLRVNGSAQDVTAQRQTQKELERLVQERTEQLQAKNRELQVSNAYLEEFAHAASHDLKEPVRKIQVFTAILKADLAARLSEKEMSTFTRIENSTQRMGILIDDLLSYSYVNQRPIEKETVNLNDKLRRVLEDLELLIAEKKATVHVQTLPVINGYRRQLQQLFQNLITNAIKYRKPDQDPVVTISCTQVYGKEVADQVPLADHQKQYYLIEVRDNGIGFEQIYAEKIFKMFQRLHGNSEYTGTGVGLSIARKVVENHNGFLYAQSTPDVGSSFFIGFPVDND